MYASSTSALATGSGITYNGTTFSTTNDASINGITVGRGAGAVSSNTAVGVSALATNSTGAFITAVGRLAATATTANFNDAFGYASLYSNASGTNNVALGFSAGYYVQGNFNTAVGSATLSAYSTLASGSYNTAVGGNALYNNTTASYNTAVGYQAGYGNTTGTQNVSLGVQAGYTNSTGNYSTYLGYQSGYLATGNLNTFVGTASGYNVTIGVQNTFVGTSTVGAGYYMTTGSKNTIIGGYSGNQGGLDIRTASNNIVLSDGDGNPRGYANSAGVWSFNGGVLSVVLTVASASTGTVTVPNGCICLFSQTGYYGDALMFSIKANGGSQGCFQMAVYSAGAWGFGTTSNPATGYRGNLWISATNTMSVQNVLGVSTTLQITFVSVF